MGCVGHPRECWRIKLEGSDLSAWSVLPLKVLGPTRWAFEVSRYKRQPLDYIREDSRGKPHLTLFFNYTRQSFISLSDFVVIRTSVRSLFRPLLYLCVLLPGVQRQRLVRSDRHYLDTLGAYVFILCICLFIMHIIVPVHLT